MSADNINSSKKRSCYKCGSPLDTRLRRNMFIKTFLFWLPLKVYMCTKCLRARYVLQG